MNPGFVDDPGVKSAFLFFARVLYEYMHRASGEYALRQDGGMISWCMMLKLGDWRDSLLELSDDGAILQLELA